MQQDSPRTLPQTPKGHGEKYHFGGGKSSHHVIAPQWSGCTGRGGYDVVRTRRSPTRRGNFPIRPTVHSQRGMHRAALFELAWQAGLPHN
eukprot:gene10232-biopygen3281